MKIIEQVTVYDNPIPQLRSHQAAFPYICKVNENKLAAVYVLGEAFESADQTSFISFSEDNGKTWSEPQKMYGDIIIDGVFWSSNAKAVKLPDGRLMAIGYAFPRSNPDLPVGNPETGGLLEDMVFITESSDEGKTWSAPREVKCPSWGPHIEASAPITVMSDGTLITPITGFPAWDGKMTAPNCGRALRSEDGGKTWNDDVVCMQFDENVLCYEQRMCQTQSGTLVNIAWNENATTGERLHNHFTFSEDGGKTWSKPESTGVLGQASFVMSIGGEKLFALHAVRRDTDKPGIYGYVIDFSEKKWNIVDSEVVWEPLAPIVKDKKMAEIFAFLKFGQPSAIMLDEKTLLCVFWQCEMGQYKIETVKVEL